MKLTDAEKVSRYEDRLNAWITKLVRASNQVAWIRARINYYRNTKPKLVASGKAKPKPSRPTRRRFLKGD